MSSGEVRRGIGIPSESQLAILKFILANGFGNGTDVSSGTVELAAVDLGPSAPLHVDRADLDSMVDAGLISRLHLGLLASRYELTEGGRRLLSSMSRSDGDPGQASPGEDVTNGDGSDRPTLGGTMPSPTGELSARRAPPTLGGTMPSPTGELSTRRAPTAPGGTMPSPAGAVGASAGVTSVPFDGDVPYGAALTYGGQLPPVAEEVERSLTVSIVASISHTPESTDSWLLQFPTRPPTTLGEPEVVRGVLERLEAIRDEVDGLETNALEREMVAHLVRPGLTAAISALRMAGSARRAWARIRDRLIIAATNLVAARNWLANSPNVRAASGVVTLAILVGGALDRLGQLFGLVF